jgi:UDP-2,3-diacylglucosamine pyrophosphatase LpxH
MAVIEERAPLHFRSVFISDIHLGTRGCQAELLLDFLKNISCEQLYLVGDIVDGWRMKRGWFWPQSHNDVVQKLLRHARKGVVVTYVPGNHDEKIRDFCGVHFGGVVVARECVHETADGRKFLVLHGDEFDAVVRLAPWLAKTGDLAYRAAIRINTVFNRIRRQLGLPYWSLSAFLKIRVKNALQFIDNYETAVAAEARRRGVDGIICGHIHKAEMREIQGVAYMNDGDWVESCTALVEHFDGRFEILPWAERRSWSMIQDSRRARSASAPKTELAIA